MEINPNETELTQIERVAVELGLQTPHARRFLQTCFENAKLFDRKQQDYGPGNIAGFGAFGVIVRMNDKFERIKNLHGKRRKPKNETIYDNMQDISVYGVIAQMIEKGRW